MRRIAVEERPNWQGAAEAQGFSFHHEGGQRYWDERAYYAFTLREIEEDIEEPSRELHAMCLDLVEAAMSSERIMDALAIPEPMRDYVADSWDAGSPTLYGRFDFAYDGTGPAKLLEYNADTPTSIYETGFFQWSWLEARIADGTLGADSDQFNSLHEKLIARFGQLFTRGSTIHFASVPDHVEDRQTVRYLEDLAGQAGLVPKFVGIEEIGVDPVTGRFVDTEGLSIPALFKLYPWEDMFREPFSAYLARSGTTFLEPAWKAILSNKAILPLLWERHTGHPNLLPAFFDGDPGKSTLGDSFVRKPLFSREGWDIEIVEGGRSHFGPEGGYGAEGHVVQGLANLPCFDGNYPVIGSWIVGDLPAGMSIREDDTRITRNLSRFLPHIIEG